MKVSIRKFLALALFTLALSGAVLAQGFDHQVRANIPFNFYANGKLQHAGIYYFSMNLQTGNITVVSRDQNTGWFLRGAPVNGSKRETAVLTFLTNGTDVYVLQKAQWPDFGVSFNTKKLLSDVADAGSINSTQTIVAQLTR